MKYIVLCKNQLQIALGYRSQIVIHLINVYLDTGIKIALWIGMTSAGVEYKLTLAQLIAYTIWTAIVDELLEFNAELIAEDINRGQINKLILKPVRLNVYYFTYNLGTKLFNFILYIPILWIFIQTNSIDRTNLLITIVLLPCAIFGYYFTKAMIGYSAAWFGRVFGFVLLQWLVMSILGGAVIPYSLLPEILQRLANIFPLRYLYALPIEALTGVYSWQDVPVLLIKQVISLAVIAVMFNLIYRNAKAKIGEIGG